MICEGEVQCIEVWNSPSAMDSHIGNCFPSYAKMCAHADMVEINARPYKVTEFYIDKILTNLKSEKRLKLTAQDKELQANQSPPAGEPKPPSRQASPRPPVSSSQPQSAPLQQRSVTASEERMVALEVTEADAPASAPREQNSTPEQPQSSLQEVPPDAGTANEAAQ